eukprot:g3978.t1
MLFEDKGCTFIAVFGALVRGEEDALRAVLAAMEMNRTMVALGIKSCRIGVSVGEGVFCGVCGPEDRRDFIVMGAEVNMAARLMGKAPIGQVMASKHVMEETESHIEYERTSSFKVKGKDKKIRGYIPLRKRTDGHALQEASSVEIVGRAQQRQQLDELITMICGSDETKSTCAVLIEGDTGMGKSVLMAYIKENVQRLNLPCLICSSTSIESSTPFFPLKHLVKTTAAQELAQRRAFVQRSSRKDIKPAEAFDAEAGEGVVDLKDIVQHLASSVEETAALEMLLFPQEDNLMEDAAGPKGRKTISKSQMQSAMTDILYRIVTGQHQMILLFDDIQWMDVSSWTLLEALFQRLCDAGCRVLACFSQRPSHAGSTWDTGRTKRLLQKFKHVVYQDLKTMDEGDSHKLISNILASPLSEVNSQLLKMIYQKTKGSPLFIRMLLKWMEESNTLERNDGGQLILTCPASSIVMPNGVKDSILNRIDGLPAQQREFLKVASCIGVIFDVSLVHGALNWTMPVIRDTMKELISRDIITRHSKDGEVNGESCQWNEVSFQEVSNSLLLESQRKAIHLSVAERLEEDVALGRNVPLDDLARHWERTGNAERALEYLERAGVNSERVYALQEASSYYRRALDCAQALEEDEDKGQPGEAVAGMVATQEMQGNGHAAVPTPPSGQRRRIPGPRGEKILEGASGGSGEAAATKRYHKQHTLLRLEGKLGNAQRLLAMYAEAKSLLSVALGRAREYVGRGEECDIPAAGEPAEAKVVEAAKAEAERQRKQREDEMAVETEEERQERESEEQAEQHQVPAEEEEELFSGLSIKRLKERLVGDPPKPGGVDHRTALGDACQDVFKAKEMIKRIVSPSYQPAVRSSPEMEIALTNLAVLSKETGYYPQALSLQKQAVEISRKLYSLKDVRLAQSLTFYAELLRKMRQFSEAEPLHRQALSIFCSAEESDALKIAESQTYLGCCLKSLNRPTEARVLFEGALLIRNRALGPQHAAVSESLNYLGEVLLAGAIEKRDAGEDVAVVNEDIMQAVPKIRGALNIRERIFGDEHPAVAHALANLAACERELNRLDASVYNYRRCIWICEERFGPYHPNIIGNLIGFSQSLILRHELSDADEVLKRAKDIHHQKLGKGPTKTLDEINSLIKTVADIREKGEAGGAFAKPCQMVVISDPGRDLDDECAMIMLAALSQTPGALVECKAFIATLAPVEERVRLARGTLDLLGLDKVPVGKGSDGGVETLPDDFTETAGAYMSPKGSTEGIEDGQALLKRVYEEADDKSLDMVVIASMKDAAIFVKEHPELFAQKSRSVLIMGGVQPIEGSDASAGTEDNPIEESKS